MNLSNKEERKLVRFPARGEASFFDAVKAGVDQYFKSNRLSPYGNFNMWIKAAVMLLLYLVPYALIIGGVWNDNTWLFLGLWLLMGLGMIGIGTAIMHDANHGALSKNKKVNTWAGHVIELVGGYHVTWKIQHNILHHTYTNVEGLDDDIDSIALLRFSPNRPLYWFHRYQFIYAWFLYTLLTLFWMSAKDFIQLFNYQRFGLLRKQKISFRKAMVEASVRSVFYYAYILVLPLLFSGVPWYTIVAGYLVMHVTAGFGLACIFQPSHVVETSAFELPEDDKGELRMKNSWAIHQVVNTADFAPRSRIVSWFIGGLNYQIEHHLFPGICHVHYRKIAAIVKREALSYGLPYQVHPTFLKALFAHGKMLRQLGRR
jgi:linoleoyl-CoA desaturase